MGELPRLFLYILITYRSDPQQKGFKPKNDFKLFFFYFWRVMSLLRLVKLTISNPLRTHSQTAVRSSYNNFAGNNSSSSYRKTNAALSMICDEYLGAMGEIVSCRQHSFPQLFMYRIDRCVYMYIRRQ